ncbi:MAG: galactokinase [Clostridia bacterium]|nr:galactokinase [Clostridia bacterium]
MNFKDLKKKFVSLYGEGDVRVFAAPGRVNLIGEHIDYNGGKVFPAALEMANVVLCRTRNDRKIRIAADDLSHKVESDLDHLEEKKGKEWGSYQLGVCDELQKAGYPLVGCDMLFWGNVPFGAGLSSSASIEVATAIAMATLGMEAAGKKAELNLIELALICQKAENNFVGVNCGIMDQFTAAMGQKDMSILLDCNSLNYAMVPMELPGYSIVICNTKKKRGLADSKYNERRAECDLALACLREVFPDLDALCSLTPGQYEMHKDVFPSEVIKNRAAHVIYENARVMEAVACMKQGDWFGFGRLLNASHTSLKELYEVSGKELDAMVETAQETEGCIGARMTGAGFGGCAVAIVKDEYIESFITTVGIAYTRLTGLIPEFYVTRAGEGARELSVAQ